MKTLTGLWPTLESMSVPATVLADWRRMLKTDFATLKPWLNLTDEVSDTYPCIRQRDCGCAHEVVRHSPTQIMAACRCDEAECPSFRVTNKVLLVYELDMPAFCGGIGRALDFDSLPATGKRVDGAPNVWCVGQYASTHSPVYFCLCPDDDMILRAVSGLMQVQPEPFILLSPSLRNRTPAVENLLRSHRSVFIPLAGALVLVGAKKFKTAKSIQPLLDRFAAQIGAGESGKLPQAKAVAEFFIRQEATRRRAGKQDRTMVSTWRVCYRGIECFLPPLAGSDLVVFLMAKQGRKFNASALTEAVRKSNGTGDGIAANAVLFGDDMGEAESGDAKGRVGELNERVVIWDATEIQKAKAKITDLLGEVKQYENAGDFSSAPYLETKNELEAWQQALRQNTKLVGKKLVPKEMQKGTFTLKANLIQKNIRKLLDKHLRNNCRPLFDHLNDKSILKFGVSNSYQPKPRINWVIEMKKGT